MTTKYKAIASKAGDQAIIITGGPNPLIIQTGFKHLSDLQSMVLAINQTLEELQSAPLVASTQEEPNIPSWQPTKEEIASFEDEQWPKHEKSGLTKSNPRETVLNEPNSLESVGQTESGVALDGSGEVLPPQRQEQCDINRE